MIKSSTGVHTVLEPIYKQKLLEYGKGSLRKGIENLIELEKSKHVVVNISTVVNLNE